jgi:hypothetical protein
VLVSEVQTISINMLASEAVPVLSTARPYLAGDVAGVIKRSAVVSPDRIFASFARSSAVWQLISRRWFAP